MPRMPSAQPPVATRMIDKAGNSACWNTSEMKCKLNDVEARDVRLIGQVAPPTRLVEAEAALTFARHRGSAGMHVAAERRLLQKRGLHPLLTRRAREEAIQLRGQPNSQPKDAGTAGDR